MGKPMSYPEVQINPEFKLANLITWLNIAQLRWGDDARVTGRLEGSGLNIYQDGVYRAAVDLDDERPCLFHWADDDA